MLILTALQGDVLPGGECAAGADGAEPEAPYNRAPITHPTPASVTVQARPTHWLPLAQPSRLPARGDASPSTRCTLGALMHVVRHDVQIRMPRK